MAKIIQSRFIRWLLLSGAFFLTIMSLLRWVFHLVFKPVGEQGSLASFWMGFRYDARVVCIFLLLVLVGGIAGLFRPFTSKRSKRVVLIFSRFFGILIILFYTFDFGNFAYLRQRMNASLLSYAEDGAISARMLWQTYPVIKIMIGWSAALVFIFYATRYIYTWANRSAEIATRRNRVITYFAAFLVFAVAIFGRLSRFPLRWSDAYRLNSDYKASLALNPFQSFVSSLKFRHSGFDEAQAKKYYGLMAKELGVQQPDPATLNYLRVNTVNDSLPAGKPNIVLVVCESFSAYKSSMWGNPLNTTPYFNELCKQGVFYKNCFSPAYGTARGVWALITGIPDVTSFKTASRNPSLVDQHTILNDIEGYEKFYFIGGSASWANIRGLLAGNIKNLHLYEQEDYHSPAVDVWGISDKDLFLEANEVIKKQTTPFFTIIQTADNHRPYTIPEEDRPYVTARNFPKDTLGKYGFWTNEELNAYSYMDYTYKVFIEAARKEKYFDNTIFIFVGDHGIRGIAGDMFPKVWTDQSLTLWHVPLLFYSPSLLQPAVVETKVSQVDIMPSIAALAHLPVSNTTLGRNLFAVPSVTDSNDHDHAFVFDFDRSLIGLVAKKYYYEYDLNTKKEGLYSLVNNNPSAKEEAGEPLVSELRNLTLGYYQTSRFMLFHNKKKK
ncbi:MAG: sulfatase-like hydrolase/transferase [Chitinophagaceae bacterium]